MGKLMGRLAALTILLQLGVISWMLSRFVTADAIAMGVGLLFGVMAGIPTTLLLLMSERNKRTPVPPPVRLYQIVSTDTGEIAPYIMKELPTSKEEIVHG
jgi:hypothetical protein